MARITRARHARLAPRLDLRWSGTAVANPIDSAIYNDRGNRDEKIRQHQIPGGGRNRHFGYRDADPRAHCVAGRGGA
ncbi:hypothetical protein [Paraburkholderia sp. BR14320]|uniref:hypothetical protein n=1 Tax=unclassified Paraburkholderia TaxID=2615204 RepID=UPI0034CED098